MEGFLYYAVVGEWTETHKLKDISFIPLSLVMFFFFVFQRSYALGSTNAEHWNYKSVRCMIWLLWWGIDPNGRQHEHELVIRGNWNPWMYFSRSSRLLVLDLAIRLAVGDNIATVNQLRMFLITAKCCSGQSKEENHSNELRKIQLWEHCSYLVTLKV